MLRTTLKSLAARKRRLLLTATAIVLGVTFVTGTLVLTDTSTRLFDDQFTQATAGVDLVVRDAATFGAAMGVEVERDPVTEQTLAQIRGTQGVTGAQGLVRGSALLVVDGEAIVPGGPSVGLSWAEGPFNPFALRSGRPPRAAGEVVIDAATAADAGVAVGDTVAVSLEDGSHPMKVVGVAGFGDADGIPNATLALFAPPAAQELFGSDGGWSEVQVTVGTEGVEPVRQRLIGALGDDLEIATSRDTAAASAAAAQEQLVYLRAMLLVLAVTALIVGAFMIANTFSIVVAQRTREFATLRALGASSRQIINAVLVEAIVVGTLASTIGVAAGVGAAAGLREVAGAFGVVIPDGPLTIEPASLTFGWTIGLIVTAVSALAPARRASRVDPVVAMRDIAASSRPVPRRRVLVGAVAVTAGSILLAFGQGVASAGTGALMVVIATVLLAPMFTGRLASLLGRVVAGRRIVSLLARTNLRRAERRTAATSIALAMGLAVVTFMTVVATSAKAGISSGVDEVIRAELIVQSARGEMLGGLSPHVHHYASEVPGVAAASRLRFGHWQRDGATEALTAIDPGTLPQVADLDMVAGELSTLGKGEIVLAQNKAAAHGVNVGDRIDLTFSKTGEQQLEVVGIFETEDAWAVSTGYLISLDTFDQHFAENVDATVFVKIADGADPAQVEADLREVLAQFPTAAIYDQTEATAARTRMLDSMLGLVTVLLLLAVLIALLGITNALALSIVERTREVGMLRAVGTTRRQIGAMVRTEAALIAAVGAVTGTVLGLLIAAATVRALAGMAAIPFTVPATQLGIYLAVATLGGVAAGLLPGRRASRMDVLTAIATH